MMIFVKPKHKKYHNNREDWVEICRLEGKDIPLDIPLTKKAISYWEKTHNALGYSNFDSLNEADVRSITSGTKRQACHMNVERWGRAAFYKLNPDKKAIW